MPFCAAPIEHYFNSWHQLSPAVMVAPNYAVPDLGSPSRSALAASPPLSIEKEARPGDASGIPTYAGWRMLRRTTLDVDGR